MEPADSVPTTTPVVPAGSKSVDTIQLVLLAWSAFATAVGVVIFVLLCAGVRVDFTFAQAASSIFLAAGAVLFVLSFRAQSILRAGLQERRLIVAISVGAGSVLTLVFAGVFPWAYFAWMLATYSPPVG